MYYLHVRHTYNSTRAVKGVDFHTKGPRFKPRPGSSILGQGALSSLPSLSDDTLKVVALIAAHKFDTDE